MSLLDTDLRTSLRTTAANLNRMRVAARRAPESDEEMTAAPTGQIVAFPSRASLVEAPLTPSWAPALSPSWAPSLGTDITAAPVAVPARPVRGVYAAIGKRLLDVALVVLSAPLWLSLVAICALLVARDGHTPFYTQLRVGRNGEVFRMFKLRSMVHNAEAKLEAYLAANPDARAEWDATQKLKNDPRITRIGRIIRKTSIDELPQMLNVLLGDMSLVGPRPFMVSQNHLYQGRAYYRLRPGLTGLWQVSERNDCNFVQRVDFDEAYGRIVSLRTDVSVLWRTVAVVLRGTGY